MDIDELRCDLFHVLQNDSRDILQKWISSCRQFRSRVAVKIEKGFLCEKNRTEMKSVNDKQLSELQQEIDTEKSEVEATVLQQKMTDKQISKIVNSQKSLRDELEKMQADRETLLLEIMDLELEMETRKRNKILQWDAIKRACHIYKQNLDIHISLQEKENNQEIKFSFFTHNSDTKDKYFIMLSLNENHWNVEQVEPKLRKEHFNQLSMVKDSPGCFKVFDLTLFLCQIRSIFLKYYMKMEKE